MQMLQAVHRVTCVENNTKPRVKIPVIKEQVSAQGFSEMLAVSMQKYVK